MATVYDFKVKDAKNNDVSLSDYKGKVLLIVNTATECGFTPQYSELQELYKKYEGKGVEILDFPCNQFGAQAPGTNDEIKTFCQTRFGVTFPQFAKIDVNGDAEIPLYTFLKAEKGFEGFPAEHPASEMMNGLLAKIDPDFKNNSKIKWNFTKFLVDKNGNVVKRYEPMAKMSDIDADIAALL
ncbi:MAG: glutathione peroxidase [Clostridia bacterium]|nr:glutathione peroxidase [Clostridia bacterium]MBQ4248548.1 glutathione peroxidase [Clostridia bacterium]